MDYDRQSHSKFLLMYHMIFVCSIGNVSKDIIEKYIQEQG